MRKIIQRWVVEKVFSSSNENDQYVTDVDSVTFLWALCDDDSLWFLRLEPGGESWEQVTISEIPQDEAENKKV